MPMTMGSAGGISPTGEERDEVVKVLHRYNIGVDRYDPIVDDILKWGLKMYLKEEMLEEEIETFIHII